MTTDGWKSRTKIPMQTIEVHYMKDGKAYHRILNVREIQEEHVDNVALMDFFKEVFNAYGIDIKKILLFVVDGGSNQLLALQKLNIPAVWCGCHAINVCVKYGINKTDALGKTRSLVSWFNASSTHTQKLRDLQRKANARLKLQDDEYISHVYVMVKDNDTRWNSWFLSIQRIIMLWPEIKTVLQEYRVSYLMNDEDIECLKEFEVMLEPFYDSTLALEADDSNLSDIILEIEGLILRMEERSTVSNKYVNCDELAADILFKLKEVRDDYYTCPSYLASVILDPSIGKTIWEKLLPLQAQTIALNWIQAEMDKITTPVRSSDTPSKPTKQPRTTVGKSFRSSIQELNPKSELEAYLEIKTGKINLLEWWSKESVSISYPTVSKVAMKLVSIPASAAISERTWSLVGLIWNQLRNRLESDRVGRLVFLKSNNDMW